MILTEDYLLAFWGIFTVLLTWLVQWFVATAAKAASPGAIPGKIDEHLGHDSFIFRSHRTFMNSLENVPLFLGTAFLALLVGADSLWSGVFIWVFAIARIMHMLLYYKIATEKNPSPRSYFFLLGVLASICLLVLCGITLA